jgi:O-antigen/teichoic acid export membrane protein
MKRYSKGHARRSLFHTAFFRMLSQLATLVSYVVLVRGLTEQAFGVLNLLYAVIPVIGTVASLGVEQTLRRFQPEYLQSGRPQMAAWLLRAASVVRFATNIVMLGLILMLWRWIAPLFQLQPYRAEFALFALLILLHFQAGILQLSLSSHMLQGYSVGMTVVLSVVKLLAYAALVHFHRLTLTTAICADLVGYGLMYLGLRFAHARHCRTDPEVDKLKLDPAERKRLLRYSFFNNFNDAGSFVLSSKSDFFFIAALANPAAVGAYAFYTRLSQMATQLLPTRQFGNVIQPLFFSVPRQEAPWRIPRYFTLLVNLNGLLQWPMLAFATAFHADIVGVLFAGKFLAQSWLLPVIVGFATINRVDEPVTMVAQYQEKVFVILLGKFSVIYNVIALLVLIPVAGVFGAAIATGSAQTMKNLYVWWHARALARWTNFGRALTMAAVIWGGCTVVCFALKHLSPGLPWVHLMVGAVLCGAATILYARSPALATSDREILASVFHGREASILRWLGILPPAGAVR